jgi:hypothetical protein
LGVLPEGESPTAASAELAETALDSVHARLEGLNLLNWPPCEVPGSVLFAVSYLAANELVDVFGSSAEQMTRISAGAERGLIEIRQQTTNHHHGTTTAVYY